MNKSILYNWQLKSLVKNIFTAIVAFTILIGTTGFLSFKHSCSIHNFSAVSFIETPVCEKDHQIIEEVDECCKPEAKEIVESSCCESEPIDQSNPVSFTSQELKCCISSIESNEIQENLFPPLDKKIISSEFVTALIPFIENGNQQTKQIFVLQNNNLPPPKFGKQLLQTIHQLKIDTPIC